MAKKFIQIATVGGEDPRYLTVEEGEVDEILNAFHHEAGLYIRDLKDDVEHVFNMANVVRMSVQDHKDNR